MMELKDAQGRYKTRSLFVETIDAKVRENGYEPIFTLRAQDLEDGTKSLKKIYLDMMDPSEMLFAEEVFGTYEHWQKLTECTWFIPHLEQWRKELELKLIGLGVQQLQKQAKMGNVNAAKALMDRKWKSDKKAVGRPRKAQTVENSEEDFSSDAERIGLRVVKSG